MRKFIKYGDNVIRFGNAALIIPDSPGPVPPILPAKTIRCKFQSGYTPTMGDDQTLVDADENIWDIYRESDDWHGLFYMYGGTGAGSILEVLGANTAGVTDMSSMFEGAHQITSVPLFDTGSVTDMNYMFSGCTSLTSVPLFDTGNVTDIHDMFAGCSSLVSVPLFNTGNATRFNGMFLSCTSLQSVPLFDTSSALNLQGMFHGCNALRTIPQFSVAATPAVADMFYGCTRVESGILAFYQRAVDNVTFHMLCFRNCGVDTVTGTAELAQIPDDWK